MLWRVISLYARPKTPRTGHLASTASSIHPFVSCISYTPSSVCSGVQPVLTPPITPGWLPHVLAAASGVKIVAASLAQMMGSHSHGVRSEMKTVSDILTGVGAGTVCGRMYCTVLRLGAPPHEASLRLPRSRLRVPGRVHVRPPVAHAPPLHDCSPRRPDRTGQPRRVRWVKAFFTRLDSRRAG
jgi:hypothetical protein